MHTPSTGQRRTLDPVTPSRDPGLDAVRGVALLLVMGGHYSRWNSPAFAGVYLFFGLSGYLITGLLLREWRGTGTIGFRRFYLRRVFRLAPASLQLPAAV